MSSTEISALVGQQQMMMAGQMQNAAMISQMAGGQSRGENVMGQAVNMATGIGSPLLQAGMSIVGADPLSMGMRGAMTGFGVGGIAGAAGGAALGAGAIGIPMMAAQYASQQILQGMSQQQNLNTMLRQNYGFMGQNGRGFTNNEMGFIGQSMRQQSMIQGPAGENLGFEELGQLASRMGQMGMANNVRNAFEFNDKFKQMLTQVKEIATAFNTSLEQAQQIMSSMRGAGIFRNQGQVAQQIREISMAGGLATSEVTGMMTVGSQYSRMIGGRGSAGAMGGMKTIGNIGMAQQMGILSEETLYDLTGLTGAEGRRALATQRMGQAANFLKGGLGRRMIASMAGANGMLDEGSAEEWEGGGVGTDRTMGMAYRNLGKVGRANFIRNEGRLRGEVLGRFGGLAPIAAMASWLEQRGMNPGDDRGLIFMSRRLGMSTEEVEQQLKEYRNLDRMESLKTDRTSEADMRRDLEAFKKGRGISGIKKKIEDAKNDVENTLRQKGADLFQFGSEMVDRWIASVTGDFAVTMDKDIGEAVREAKKGWTESSKATWERRFGGGRGLLGRGAGLEGQLGMRGMSEITRVSDADAFASSGDLDQYRKGGWGGVVTGGKGVRAQLAAVRDIRNAGTEGGAGQAYRDFGLKNRDALLSIAGTGGMQGRGMDFLSKFGDVLNKSGNEEIAAAYGRANMEERARIMRDVLGSAGMGHVADKAMADIKGNARFGMSGWRTAGERQEARGNLMRAAGRTEEQQRWLEEKIIGDNTRGDVAEGVGTWGVRAGVGVFAAANIWNPLGWGAAAALGVDTAMGGRFSRGVGQWLRDKVETQEGLGGLTKAQRTATAAFAETEAGRDLAMGALSREPADRKAARTKAARRNVQLLAQTEGNTAGELSDLSRGEYEHNVNVQVTGYLSEFEDHYEKLGREPTKEEEAEFIQKLQRSGLGITSVEDARARRRTAASGVMDKQAEAREQYTIQTGKEATKFLGGFRQAGLFQGGRFTSSALGKITAGPMVSMDVTSDTAKAMGFYNKAGGTQQVSAGAMFMARLGEAAKLEEEAAGMEAGDARDRLQDRAREIRGSAYSENLGSMSGKQLRELAGQVGKMGVSGAAMKREILGVAKFEEKAQRVGRTGDRAMLGREVGKMIGVDLSNEELRELRGKGMTTASVAEMLASKGGLDAAGQEDLRKALQNMKEGKAGAGQQLREVAGKVAEQQREQNYESSKKNDPTVRAITEMSSKITGALKENLNVNVKNTVKTEGADTKSAEKPPGG